MTNENRTLLIDGSSLFKHSYHGSQKGDQYKEYDSVIICMLIVRRIFNQIKSICEVVAFWDGAYSAKLRYDIYPAYKSNRNKIYHYENESDYVRTQEEVIEDVEKAVIQEIFYHLHFKQHESNQSEADDCIAQYVIDHPNENITIVTGDSDLFQLMSDNVNIYYLSPKKQKKGIYTPKRFLEVYGYSHTNICILKSIVGDNADKVDGIVGWGLKGFTDHFGDLLGNKTSVSDIVNKAKLLSEKEDIPKRLANKLPKLFEIENDEIYNIMYDIVNLEKPMLDDKDVKAMENLVLEDIDTRKGSQILEIFSNYGFTEKLKFDYNYNDMRSFLVPFFNYIEIQRKCKRQI